MHHTATALRVCAGSSRQNSRSMRYLALNNYAICRGLFGAYVAMIYSATPA